MSGEQIEKKKDLWDKFSAVGPFLSGLIIAGVGFYFTQNYNAQQLRLSEIQTVEKFIPRLLGTQEEKELAIIAISSMGNTHLATKLATRYPSEGTAAALETLSKTGDPKDQERAQEGLKTVKDAINREDQHHSELIKQMFDEDKNTRISVTAKLIRELGSDEKVIPTALDYANNDKTNQSGIINTLVVLENKDPRLLKRYGTEIVDFLDSVKGNGPQTALHVDKVKALVVDTGKN